MLSGPSSAPAGAVTVDPAVDNDLYNKTIASAAGTVFWLAPGAHTLGASQFGQVIPKTGNTYLGAPGAVLDGRNINRYAFTGQAANVTIKYLEIKNFACPLDEFVVQCADNWTVQYCNCHQNTGAALGMGTGSHVSYCWMHDNSQYGFSSYRPAVNSGATNAISNITIDHCEVAGNGTLADEINPDGTPTYNGRNGGCKFWDTNGITLTNNWIHDGNWVGVWADTNNVVCHFENNLVENNKAEGFMYEISYNFLVTNNTFRRNAITKGLNFASRSDNFPVAAIYISEAGGDSGAATTYAASSIESNTFIDNWGDLTLWENADRFCNSPTNTSSKVYKPLGHGASLAICNQPTTKTWTVTLTAGSPNFAINSGTGLEFTDEGRPISGTGIPTGTTILAPTYAGAASGYISAGQGVMSANATASGTVTMTVAAGSINVDPAYTACRWHTQNIAVKNNSFSHDRTAVLGSNTIPAGVTTGKIAVLSQFGSFPSWSPYQGAAIETAITFGQNNVWSNNAYAGGYSWMAQNTATIVGFPQWQGSPYNQDAGSTFTTTPGGGGGGGGGSSLFVVAEWTVSGGQETQTIGTWAYSGGSVVPVIARRAK